MVAMSDEKKAKEAELVRQMSTKLRHDIVTLERHRDAGMPRNFLEFCKIRSFHNDIQWLVSVIEGKIPGIEDRLPDNMVDWIIQAKMKALGLFVEISRAFVGDPPLTLTGSLTARDVLSNEQKNFAEAHAFFNKILMEQALDDKTADRLVNTLTLIEETIAIIDQLLSKSVNYLDEF